MSEATKQAVLAKCQEAAPIYGKEQVQPDGVMIFPCGDYVHIHNKSRTVCVHCNTSIHPDDEIWAIAADILKVGRFSIPQKVWEDNIKEGLEEARQMGYEQGVKVAIGIANITTDALGLPRVFVDGEAVEVKKAQPEPQRVQALEKRLKDAENELFQLVMAEIGSSFNTSIVHTIRKLKEAQPEPARPSDALLMAAWNKASGWGYSQCVIGTHSSKLDDAFIDAFTKWLATLPPDPLAKDRETLRRAMDEGTINVISKEVAEALDRLAGKEVGNE